MTARKASRSGAKAGRNRGGESRKPAAVALLVRDLKVKGLARLMGVDAKSVKRWAAGAVTPSGMASAFLAVLNRLRRERVDLEALPGRLVVTLHDRINWPHAVDVGELIDLWWDAQERKHQETADLAARQAAAS